MSFSEAKSRLDLDDGFTLVDLKKAYRFAATLVHPDKGGTEEQFNDIQSAFELLKSHCSNSEDAVYQEATIEGKPLSEFGKGYPITESARVCEGCEGRGYKEFFEKGYVTEECPKCKGDGAFWLPCKRCGGSGKFKNKYGKEVGECFLCGGSGKFYPPYKGRGGSDFFSVFFDNTVRMFRNIRTKDGVRSIRVNCCKECSGNTYVRVLRDKEQKYYMKCQECDGIGEIKMWNPVIPRGLFRS